MAINNFPSEIEITDGNIDILLGRLTSTRGGYLDNLTDLDVAVTTVSAVASTANLNAEGAITAANNTSTIASTANLNAGGAITAANNASTAVLAGYNMAASASSAANLARISAAAAATGACVSARVLAAHCAQWIQTGHSSGNWQDYSNNAIGWMTGSAGTI
jgi:hypothetical protein